MMKAASMVLRALLVMTVAAAQSLSTGCASEPGPINLPGMAPLPRNTSTPSEAPPLLQPNGTPTPPAAVTVGGPEKYPLVAPTYQELADWVNRRSGAVNQLWARAAFKSKYTKEDGTVITEDGEGWLMLARPSQVALIWTKVGQHQFWAGCDAEKYWVFSRPEVCCWVGRNKNLRDPASDKLGWSFHPLALPDLVGLIHLPALEHPPEVSLQRIDLSETEPRTAWSFVLNRPDYPVRLSIDPQTWLPVRVEMLDGKGVTIVVSDLYNYTQASFETSGNRLEVSVPRSIRLTSPGVDGIVEITTSDVASRPPDQPTINAAVFNFERIDRTMRPARFVVVDHACAEPAIDAETRKRLEEERAKPKD